MDPKHVIDWSAVRAQFPGLQRVVNGKPLIYLDNANTAPKFLTAIAAGDAYYTQYTANVFRGVHTMAEEATHNFEAARDVIKNLINAPDRAEVIFTRGTTEAINLVAYSWTAKNLRAGDAVLITEMEHHANLVPWQLACERVGATLKVLPVTDAGTLDLDQLAGLLTAEVRLFAFAHVSNALGTINPVTELCRIAAAKGITTLIDGSQAAPHQAIDVQAIGCDFYCFTGHKMYGPTGTGVLWGKRQHLEAMPPFLSGGEMIETVTLERSSFAKIPNKFEAGTPNIAGFIGLAAAIESLQAIGLAAIAKREAELGKYCRQQLLAIPGLRLLGNDLSKVADTPHAPVFSFVIDGAHANDLAMLLDQDGIAIRSGQHCAHPLMRRFGVTASARVSLSFYNSIDEIDLMIASLRRAIAMLAS
jgi:cysteine desulfurase / selenocysteine lyase